MTERMTLFFEPLDVLQFRDHKPFDAGLDTTAESVFPMPSVFYGHLRSVLVAERCPDFATDGDHFRVPEPWATLLGGPSKVGTLALRGPVFARTTATGIEPLFFPPRDLVQVDRSGSGESGREQREWRVLALRDWPMEHAPRIYHDDGSRLIDAQHAVPWSEEAAVKDPPKILLTPSGARAYFLATDKLDLSGDDTVPEGDVFVEESRVGIALDPSSRTATEGMFYTARTFRLHPGYGFAVDIEVSSDKVRDGLTALHGRAFPLGGKGHRARVHVMDGALLPALAQTEASVDKRWLVSPLPIGAAIAELKAMVTGRAALVGGYDFAKRAPKPLRRALPWGTVIRLRPGQTLRDLFGNDEDRKMGYGTAFGEPSVRSDA